jgi:hypothetical protein
VGLRRRGGSERIGGKGVQVCGCVRVYRYLRAVAVDGVVVEIVRRRILVAGEVVVVEVVEVVEERGGARNGLVWETAMVHGVVVVDRPPPITPLVWRWGSSCRGGLLLCTRLWRSEQDLRIPEIIDVPCGPPAGGGVHCGCDGRDVSGPVDVDALASTRIGWIGLDWLAAEATGDSPGRRKHRVHLAHKPNLSRQAAGGSTPTAQLTPFQVQVGPALPRKAAAAKQTIF